MTRWDEGPAPSRLARWVARHLRGVQVTWGLLALGSAALGVWSISTDGWGHGTWGLLESFLFVCLAYQARGTAAAVHRYDERRQDVSGGRGAP